MAVNTTPHSLRLAFCASSLCDRMSCGISVTFVLPFAGIVGHGLVAGRSSGGSIVLATKVKKAKTGIEADTFCSAPTTYLPKSIAE